MSWDIILEKPLSGAEPGQLAEDDREVFELTAVTDTLEALCPQITELRPLWMLYEEPCFEIEFDLAEDIIMLHVHILHKSVESQFMALIAKLCQALQCRALDTTSGEYLI